MELSNQLQILSIGIETLSVITGLALAIRRKKVYGWLISLTFTLYIFFDLSRIYWPGISPDLHSLAFLAASVAILITFWLMYRES